MTGQLIAHYRITAKLGEGGMGAVYRAIDTKLNREIAIKVLPAAFAQDADRMARFQREAQVLASLNHPNIAAIYGVEDRALVMELVEGETLRGPLPVDEALALAHQLSEALEYAHEKGIVHRDLKPANIKVTPEGKLKVLDFGLAKAMEDSPSTDLSNSPTMSVAATRAGVILGTAGYMSPEQARGKGVDKRADIWAFGCVLYELLAGKRTFEGESVSDSMAAVLTREPDWSALPVGAPVAMLRRCLEKDSRRRLRDIGDAWGDARAEAEQVRRVQRPLSRPSSWIVAFSLALALIIQGTYLRRATPSVAHPPMRFNVDLGPDAALDTQAGAAAILSPDGTRLVYVSRGSDGKPLLYTRLLEQKQAAPLAGTENVRDPFFSPDGQWVGFFAEGKLKKISVQGGAAVVLCDAPGERGGTWADDGSIIFTPDYIGSLSQVSSAGGSPKRATELRKEKSEITHRWPQVLPGGQAVLFTAHSAMANFDGANLEVHSFKTGQSKTLVVGGYYGRFLSSGSGTGHLVYVHQGTMFAAPMDLDTLSVTGTASPVPEDVVSNPGSGTAQFEFSRTGMLAFLMGKAMSQKWSVAWLDSAGRTQPLRASPATYYFPRFSPDGKRLALVVMDGDNYDLLVYDWTRDMVSRLVFTPGFKGFPVWTPDGRHIVYGIRGAGKIFWIRADGSGEAQVLVESKSALNPSSFSPDGKHLAYFAVTPGTGARIWTVPLDLSDPDHPKPGTPERFSGSSLSEANAAFSPDGRWVAYMSHDSGVDEVYVRPFPGSGGRWQISNGGGNMPVWSRNGRELFYRTPDNRIMVATYTAKGDTFVADKPRLWSEKRFIETFPFPNFDLAPDGKRFAVLLAPEEEASAKAPTHLTFLLNFSEDLRRRETAGGAK